MNIGGCDWVDDFCGGAMVAQLLGPVCRKGETERERERESKAEQTAKQGTERAVTMAHFPFWDTTSEAAKFE